MDLAVVKPVDLQAFKDLETAFGARLQNDLPLARFTAARLGGPAELFLEVRSLDELVRVAQARGARILRDNAFAHPYQDSSDEVHWRRQKEVAAFLLQE